MLFLSVFAAVLSSDLWIKAWSFNHVAGVPVKVPANYDGNEPNQYIPPHNPTVVVPHVLNLQLTFNTGAVFGMGKGRQIVFILVSVVAAVVVVVVAARTPATRWPAHLALALILAGALGNLYDRVTIGAVRDMFHLFPNTRLWPWIWNVADAALMVGVGIMMIVIWVTDKPPQSEPATRD